MSNSIVIPGFYLKQGIIYKENDDESLQDANRRAHEMAISLIQESSQAKEVLRSASRSTIEINDPFSSVWFWLYLHHATYYGGSDCCGNPGHYSGGHYGGNRDGSAALLVLAVISACFAVFVGVGFTSHQAMRAEEIRKELKEAREGADIPKLNPHTATLYKKVEAILEIKWKDKALIALFTATITLGLVFLTVSSSFALYERLHYFSFSNVTADLAITGSVLAVLGVALHLIRLAWNPYKKEKHESKYLDLAQKLNESAYIPSPLVALQQCTASHAYLLYQDRLFVKEGASLKHLDAQDLFSKVDQRLHVAIQFRQV